MKKLKSNNKLNLIYKELIIEKEIAKKNKILSREIQRIESTRQEMFTKIKLELINLNFTYQEICTL